MPEFDKNLRPLVGVGVMIIKDGKVLLGKRKISHGEGAYIFPGGHLEYMESFEECARREVREEAGIEIKEIKFLRVYNLKDFAPKHYVDVSFTAKWLSGEPKTLEPDKVDSWDWYDLNDLPTPLFAGMDKTIESYNTGRDFFDA